jgi:hypothetical protein
MSELADIRRDLEEIEAMRKAIGSFGTPLSALRPRGHPPPCKNPAAGADRLRQCES